jgi:hypothetical protein
MTDRDMPLPMLCRCTPPRCILLPCTLVQGCMLHCALEVGYIP